MSNRPTLKMARGAGPEGLRLQVIPFEQRTDFDAAAMRPEMEIYVLTALFTTMNGSWNVGDTTSVYGIEPWAREAYLFPQNDPRCCAGGGGDHNIFGVSSGRNGERLPGAGFVWTSNGVRYLQPVTDAGKTVFREAAASGWADIPIFASNEGCRPEVSGSCPWAYSKLGMADIVTGIGLPGNQHVSVFGEWRQMTWAEYAGDGAPAAGGTLLGGGRLDRLVALAVPQMAGTRKATTIAQRAAETLALLEAEVGDDE